MFSDLNLENDLNFRCDASYIVVSPSVLLLLLVYQDLVRCVVPVTLYLGEWPRPAF
jgi:hypothetical protein